MRAMAAPLEDIQEIYQTCVNSITNECLRNRLIALENDICMAAADYEQKAKTKQLYNIPPNSCKNGDIVLGMVTKEELKQVYSDHMVGPTKPARKIYDLLLSRAPLGKCPFCGFGHARTLDHYLPKTKYPQLSVVPLNLVPSCRDCNTGKSTSIATTEETQSLHPYFDQEKFINEQWLFAKIIHTAPIVIQFYVDAPVNWDSTSRKRVLSHFDDFKLASRYSIEASTELSFLRNLLSNIQPLGTEPVKDLLNSMAKTHSDEHRNSWKTAMYQMISASTWYCSGGFQ